MKSKREDLTEGMTEVLSYTREFKDGPHPYFIEDAVMDGFWAYFSWVSDPHEVITVKKTPVSWYQKRFPTLSKIIPAHKIIKKYREKDEKIEMKDERIEMRKVKFTSIMDHPSDRRMKEIRLMKKRAEYFNVEDIKTIGGI